MNEIPVAEFRMASELFQAQVRGEFGNRIVADILEPMMGELETLAADKQEAQEQISNLESQLNEED